MPRISRRARTREREFSVYAIVRCGGRQERASVDDVLTIDKLAGEIGSSVTLPAVLVVDDGEVISDPAKLGGYQVTAEILGAAAGPKINMIHYKNKTGYRRRLGHRQKYTQVKITGIAEAKASSSKSGPAKSTTAKPAAKPSADKPAASKSGSSRSTAAKSGTQSKAGATSRKKD
jgi:large subunit ribosomal protein L21